MVSRRRGALHSRSCKKYLRATREKEREREREILLSRCVVVKDYRCSYHARNFEIWMLPTYGYLLSDDSESISFSSAPLTSVRCM
ncbi:hypothetical protein PUN28_000373 [Cardiocondyla obscurior]|uniref:Uncharacterized protein n=1 Tax=Cardiocondyla obscurior TaxID=286306 RepID=A0AAW2GZF8_9HYME